MTRKPQESLDFLGGLKKLTDSEYQIMNIIWNSSGGISSDEIYKMHLAPRGTISTILYKISEKGYVSKVQRGRHHIYTPLVQKIEYEQAIMNQRIKKNLGFNSLEQLMVSFCGINDSNEENIAKAKKLLDDLKNNSVQD